VLPGARPVTLPAPRPAIEPGALPAAEPHAPPVTRPGPRPTTRPDVRSATPATRPRQFKAFRLATIGAAGLVIFAVAAGSAEVAHNGFQFFVFRQGGTGSTGGNSTDQQFLDAQQAAKGRHAPNAPHTTKTPGAAKAHHAARPPHK
jgi:hypothetical protein